MRVALLVNGAAGRGRARAAADAVSSALTAAGLDVEPVPAADRTAAEVAVRALVGRVDAVAALGGDGVAHAAVQGLAGTDTPLAVLPAGTGNDLALALGVPAGPVSAAAAAAADLLAGTGRRIDLARTRGLGDTARTRGLGDTARTRGPGTERWWATVLCCGFDGAVSDRVTRLRWPPGRRRYDVAIAVELARLRPRPVRLTVDGVSSVHEVTLVAVGNTSCYGGGLRICPDADPTDGLLDITVVGPIGRRELVRTRPRLAAGSHVTHPAVQVLRGRDVQVEAAGPAAEGLTTWAEGELVGPLPTRTVVVPAALSVLGTGRR